MTRILVLFSVFLLLASCSDEDKNKEAIAAVPITLEVERFDEKFANASPDELPELKREFPYLFPRQYPDSVWVNKMQDTLQVELEREVFKTFSSFRDHEENLKSFFQHLKYYFPKFEEPKVITVISDVDYRNKVVAADSLLFIGLDNFLGEDHYFYVDIPAYIRKNMKPEQLLPEVAEVYAKQLVAPPANRTFLELMIYHGKIQFLKQQFLSGFDAHRVFGYTSEEWQWAEANQAEIWRYFIDGELLYSTDPQLAPRFINAAPFSKFYLELDNESPGRLGQYMGFQIVQAYFKNNTVSLADLLRTPGEDLFKNAKFKPKKQ